MNPTSGSIVANRFQLLRELGRGTMGTVWLARHLTLDVQCAVKFMTVDAAREPIYAARFALEARAIAQIQSPHIVRVLDYDLWNGIPFIAMERLVGEDLRSRLQTVHRLDIATTRRIVVQVARGLSRAHAAGIIHRDLKPENVFLARESDDGDEVVKLVDFGIAKLEGRAVRRTQVGEVLGTPAYMSPEQARCAQEIDARADLWSLGAIAFECLTGHLAFDGDSLGETFARILFEPMPVPSQLAPELPPLFDSWFARATSRDPDGRFADAREMSDALERVLVEGPPRGRLELVTSRTLRPTPRRRRSVGPLAVLGLGAGVIAALVLSSMPPNGSPILHARPALAPAPLPSLAPVAPTPSTLASAPTSPLAAAPTLASALTPAVTPAPALTPALTPAPAVPLAPAPAPAPAVTLTPAPAVTLAPALVRSPPKSLPRRPLKSSRAPRPAAAAETQSAGECAQGQRRCSGTVLQLCNASLDGWTDFIDCGESALCDATASVSGPCVPLAPLSPARPP